VPIDAAKNISGHTKTASIKNTGSSPILLNACSPKNLIISPKTRLCRITLSPMPRADEPERIKKTLKILRKEERAPSMVSVSPRSEISTLSGVPARYPTKGTIRKYIAAFEIIKNPKVTQKITIADKSTLFFLSIFSPFIILFLKIYPSIPETNYILSGFLPLLPSRLLLSYLIG
jgi:hypothetical protein